MSPSIWQIGIVLLIVLVLFGPKRIPGLGKSLGEAIRGFKKGLTEDKEIDVTDSSNSEKLANNSKKSESESEPKTKSKTETETETETEKS